jgi:hypothetical protein
VQTAYTTTSDTVIHNKVQKNYIQITEKNLEGNTYKLIDKKLGTFERQE